MSKRTKLTIEVSELQLAALSVLDEHGEPRNTLIELTERVVDGVTRPGAWEREWLERAFGGAWERHLERAPACYWWERQRR